uniref:WAP domain-containing protein n=1 Tax=Globodera pallida TaxID=36090 RepID=A0A183BPC5_GLOPA
MLLRNFTTCLIGLVVIFALFVPTSADKNLMDELRDLDVFQLKSGVFACPLPVVGERCPESNSLFYFKCCGDLNASCCVRLQTQLDEQRAQYFMKVTEELRPTIPTKFWA